MAIREPLAVPPPFESVAEVADALATLERSFLAARDLRGLFVMTYVVATHTIQQWIDRGVFFDNQMMARLVVAFANGYRRALAEWGAGNPARLSVAWRQSFDACNAGSGTAFQCLMLGINAHINRDLPYAIVEAGVDLDCTGSYLDFTRINDMMDVPLVRRRIARAYRRELSVSQRWFGHVIDVRVARGVERARRHSWTLAQLLVRADTGAARAKVDKLIEQRAALAGQKILENKNAPANCVAALYDIEPPSSPIAFEAALDAVDDLKRITTLAGTGLGANRCR